MDGCGLRCEHELNVPLAGPTHLGAHYPSSRVSSGQWQTRTKLQCSGNCTTVPAVQLQVK